jgi:hypothetical protein
MMQGMGANDLCTQFRLAQCENLREMAKYVGVQSRFRSNEKKIPEKTAHEEFSQPIQSQAL